MVDVVVRGGCPETSKEREADGGMMNLDTPVQESRQSQNNTQDCEKGVKKSLKRKRALSDVLGTGRGSLVAECQRELDVLFEFYKENVGFRFSVEDGMCSSHNSMIACLLEESSLPFSKLVDEIYDKLKGRDGINLASVRGAVLFVGQRMMYGIADPDADVLEDETESCLWCWESRDLKLLPATQRGFLNVRRVGRRKIHERISALSATLSALSKPESHEAYKTDLIKASEKLGKALNTERIRSLMEKMNEKNGADMAEKEVRVKEREMIKKMARDQRNMEKEKKRLDREIHMEKLQSEKELKRLHEEAEKEERRREKDAAELNKQLKKQQEEADRDQRRREKEDAEKKKQLAIKKQATIMERFLKCRKSMDISDNVDKTSGAELPSSDLSCKTEIVVNRTTSLMDAVLFQQNSLVAEDLLKLNLAGWRKSCHSNRMRRWGVRMKPKIDLVKELKLQGSSADDESHEKNRLPNGELACHNVNNNPEPSPDKRMEGWDVLVESNSSCHGNVDMGSTGSQFLIRKLLQFDKSPRPAYYGTWQKKSVVVGPRRPFAKEPDLDYDVNSDEEWEEEDPGESLSDCDKDDGEEQLEEGALKTDDENESEDSFVVPDGHLSENEVESSSIDIHNEAASSPYCTAETETEEFRLLLAQQKCLNNLTDQALRKSQPLVILNLMHEKAQLSMAEDLTAIEKLQQKCLQALCMRAYPGGTTVDISVNHNTPNKDQDVCQSQSNHSGSTAGCTSAVIQDTDLPEFVYWIRAYPHGINKVVESLQCKFPNIPKSQIKNKVRDIADFVDNLWQVKKEVLDRLGLPLSPSKGARPRDIATFFSKRCLPPTKESANTPESSPQPSQSKDNSSRDTVLLSGPSN